MALFCVISSEENSTKFVEADDFHLAVRLYQRWFKQENPGEEGPEIESVEMIHTDPVIRNFPDGTEHLFEQV